MKRLFFLLLCSAYGIAFAQTSYVTLTKDIDVDRGGKTVKLFTGSTLQQVTDTLFIKVTEAKETDNNKKGKVVKDAIFPVLKKDNDKNKTHFRDAADKDRYDASIDFDYVLKILYDLDTLFINKDVVRSVEINEDQENIKADIIKQSIITPYKQLVVKSTYPIKGIVLDGKSLHKATNDSVSVLADFQTVRVILKNNVPDICLVFEDFNKEQIPIKKSFFDNFIDFFIGYWLYILIFIFIIALLGFVFFFYVKPKYYTPDQDEDIGIAKNKVISEPSSSTESNYEQVISEIKSETKKVEDSLKNVELSLKKAIETEIAKINNKTEDSKRIAKLEENNKTLTLDKEDLTKKNLEEKEATKKALEEVETWKNKCSELDKELEQARVVPEDVVALSKNGVFVSFAQNLLSLCEKAEKDVISFMSGLDEKNRNKLAFLLSEYTLRMPMAARNMWSAVIEGLNVSGYIKNPELVKYLKNQNEAERLKFIQKHFYEDVLIPYLSSLVVLLESIRTCDKLNVTTKPSFDCSKAIREIVSLCKQNNIIIAYLPLFENLKDEDYDSIEISESLPPAISDQLSNQPQGQPLFVSQYAISSNISEKTQKTKCVVKM